MLAGCHQNCKMDEQNSGSRDGSEDDGTEAVTTVTINRDGKMKHETLFNLQRALSTLAFAC